MTDFIFGWRSRPRLKAASQHAWAAALLMTFLACPVPLPELVEAAALRCGDGIVSDGESCDDANNVNEDSCTNSCQVATCGDGIQRTDLGLGLPGHEQCDDGEQNGDDKDCTTLCYQARCGDNLVHNQESCDDGNPVETDACRSDCSLARCGDGVQRTDLSPDDDDYEECDDGNASETDACLSSCTLAICGDGFVRTGLETCDDGNAVETDACLSTCLPARCGDAIVRLDIEAGNPFYENCDDGNQDNRDACLTNCLTAECGDQVVRLDLQEGDVGHEGCDDGNEVNSDVCTNACQIARCGDGIVRQDINEGAAGYEECEDNNEIDHDDCSNACTINACGNGRVDVGEACDDGNLSNIDSCLANCEQASCGDGFVRTDLPEINPAYEECDDGNLSNADGCNAACDAYPDGSSEERAVANCASLKSHYPEVTNGPIWSVRPNGETFQSYCDFTTDEDNAPWTRCMMAGTTAGGYDEFRLGRCRDWGSTKLLFKVYGANHRLDENLEQQVPAEIVRLSQSADRINNLLTIGPDRISRWRYTHDDFNVTDLGGSRATGNHDGRVYQDWYGSLGCAFGQRFRAELCIGGDAVPTPSVAHAFCGNGYRPEASQIFCISSDSYGSNQGLSLGALNKSTWSLEVFVEADAIDDGEAWRDD